VSPRIGVVQFPGTNCELDVAYAVEQHGGTAEMLWHGDATTKSVDAVVVPGGFAHGDYLRTGAMARFSPVMSAVAEHAAAGGAVVGICNGFQVLCEAGLLPGALQKNTGSKFLCETVVLRVETATTALTNRAQVGDTLRVPINHFEGNYVCDAATLDELRAEDRIVVRYVDNPNGSLDDIAGICNATGNVVGLMPHPERASDALLGSSDGVVLLKSLLEAAAVHGAGQMIHVHESAQLFELEGSHTVHSRNHGNLGPSRIMRSTGQGLHNGVQPRRTYTNQHLAFAGRPLVEFRVHPAGQQREGLPGRDDRHLHLPGREPGALRAPFLRRNVKLLRFLIAVFLYDSNAGHQFDARRFVWIPANGKWGQT
jgi:phosphoribosylformylglycinamidine synthase